MQRQISIDDSNEGDIWKMQPLRDHLRPDQDINLACAKCAQRFATSSRHPSVSQSHSEKFGGRTIPPFPFRSRRKSAPPRRTPDISSEPRRCVRKDDNSTVTWTDEK